MSYVFSCTLVMILIVGQINETLYFSKVQNFFAKFTATCHSLNCMKPATYALVLDINFRFIMSYKTISYNKKMRVYSNL